VEIVSENLKLKKENLSYPGYSNDTIFDIFCRNISRINQNDIIEFGWAPQERFKLGSSDGKWVRMLPGWSLKDMRADGKLDEISQNTIDELFINRTNPIYKKELFDRIKFINYILPKNKIIHWSWAYPNEEFKTYKTIKNETNGKINDDHWTEESQQQLSEWVIDKINSNQIHHNGLINTFL
jgi:hypothetical protein